MGVHPGSRSHGVQKRLELKCLKAGILVDLYKNLRSVQPVLKKRKVERSH